MLRSIPRVAPLVRNLVCLAAVTAIPFSAGISRAQQSGDPVPRDLASWPPINPLANRTADANRILEDSMKLQDNRRRFEKLNLQRQKEMTSDTEKLLALAGQLKSETDKISREALSMEAVQQVEEIEKLAHSVRDKMRATITR